MKVYCEDCVYGKRKKVNMGHYDAPAWIEWMSCQYPDNMDHREQYTARDLHHALPKREAKDINKHGDCTWYVEYVSPPKVKISRGRKWRHFKHRMGCP
jgi:hypothetical protein